LCQQSGCRQKKERTRPNLNLRTASQNFYLQKASQLRCNLLESVPRNILKCRPTCCTGKHRHCTISRERKLLFIGVFSPQSAAPVYIGTWKMVEVLLRHPQTLGDVSTSPQLQHVFCDLLVATLQCDTTCGQFTKRRNQTCLQKGRCDGMRYQHHVLGRSHGSPGFK